MNDFILNGVAHGPIAHKLLSVNGDVRILRPYYKEDGRVYVSQDIGGEERDVFAANATASLTKEAWIQLDTDIMMAAKPRLKAVGDLISRNLVYNLPNGMAHTVLQSQRMGDVSDATISMDGRRRGRDERLEFDLTNLPLPIIHKDFDIPVRQLLASRNGNAPLDTSGGTLAAEKVAEAAEKLLLGTSSSFTYGGGTVYGYTNTTSSISRTITNPTDSSWTPATLLAEVLLMRQDAKDDYHYGPYILYFGTSWDAYLDNNFSTQYPEPTLRRRLEMIDGISQVSTLDFLPGYAVLLIELNTNVVREVIGMNITTIQWTDGDGMELHYKVMAIMVPQIREDINGKCGIVYGSTS